MLSEPVCPHCEGPMLASHGLWECVNDDCPFFAEQQNRNEIENEQEARWQRAQERNLQDDGPLSITEQHQRAADEKRSLR